jgi:tetratricopeptide (TPR) repeat protein
VLLNNLQQLREQYPADTQLMITVALLLEDMGETRAALKEVQQVFGYTPNQLQAIVLEVKLRQDLGESDDLYGRMQAILEQEPENSRLRMQYARLLTRNDLAEAQRQFEILLKQSPNNPDLLFSLALIHRENKELDQARVLLHRLLALRQRADEAHFYLGKTAEEQGQFEEALQQYMQVQPGRDFINATNRIAALLLASGHEEELGQYFDRLRQRLADSREQLFALEADNLNANGQLEASLAVLNRGLVEFPESTSLQYSRSMLYERLGDLQKMEQELRAIIAREPDNATAMNALGYTLANKTDRYEEAEQLIARALQLDPGEPAILDSMGWVKYRLGNYPEALDYLRQAYELFPDPEVAAHLGEVLWALGQQQTAREVWSTALEGNPQHTVLIETIQRLGANPNSP